MTERVHAFATQTTYQRLMLSLLQFAHQLGSEQPGGIWHLQALPHWLLASHVGTSREIITTEMIRLRRLGLIQYSRKHLDVDCTAMEQAMRALQLPVRSHATKSF